MGEYEKEGSFKILAAQAKERRVEVLRTLFMGRETNDIPEK